jgi:hypothetical protein
MRENRPSGSEGGAGEKPLFLPLSPKHQGLANAPVAGLGLTSLWHSCGKQGGGMGMRDGSVCHIGSSLRGTAMHFLGHPGLSSPNS